MSSSPRWSIGLAVLLFSMVASAKPMKYAGVHPRTGKPDGGLCFIQYVHTHPFPPSNEKVLYRQHDGVYVFIGDPVPFGYEGPRHSYYGHHPVAVNVIAGDSPNEDIEYCYLDGPHFHAFEPPPGQKFEQKGEVYYYADKYPPAYEQDREARAQVNVIYRPIVYARPVVVGPPPVAYVGPHVEVVAPHVDVVGPHVGVDVHVPIPTVGVHVGPAIHVHDHFCGHTVFVGKPHKLKVHGHHH